MSGLKKIKGRMIVGNGVSLMIFQAAKIFFPILLLPYLTRIFSTEIYGVITYVRVVMNYMQIFVDFGFVLSGTKDVVEAKHDSRRLAIAAGETLLARVILGIFGLIVVLLLCAILPILRENFLFTILSYCAVFLSVFLLDFLFRGLEIMHIITIRFLVMKIISTVLTFVLVKDDSNMLLIPILDIISSLVATFLVFFEVKRRKIKMHVSGLKNVYLKIKDSFIYFLSSAAATSLNAMSTIIIGFSASTTEVAYWGLAMQVIGTITALYNPISDSLYPEMIRTKRFGLIKKVLKTFLPIVIVGCIITYFASNIVFKVLGGEEYLAAVPAFKVLIPVLLFGFLSILFGWPTLGCIKKTKEVTMSTIISAIFNITVLVLLWKFNIMSLIGVAFVRVLTEALLFGIRYYYTCKNRKLFEDYKKECSI